MYFIKISSFFYILLHLDVNLCFIKKVNLYVNLWYTLSKRKPSASLRSRYKGNKCNSS